MMILHRISLLTRVHTRSMVFTQTIHLDADPGEKVIPLSKFKLDKPLVGRTNGKQRMTMEFMRKIYSF